MTTAQDTPQAANVDTSVVDAPKADATADNATGQPKTALTQDPADTTQQKDMSDTTDGQGQDKDKDKPLGAPESYADFTLPENMEVNSVVLDEFKTMAKEANLPQEQAQKFVGMGAKIAEESVTNFANSQVEAYAQKVQNWHQERAKDPEIGGTDEAQNLVLSSAGKVVRALGGESLLKALDETGAGNHPEIIRAFYRIRDVVGEDGKLIQGNLGGSSTEKSAAQALYPDLPTQST